MERQRHSIYFALIGVLLFSSICFAAPPTRQNTYTSGNTISSANVTSNEDTIFNYLQGGVDTIKDNSIVNADVASNANIQSDKLNLSSINQATAMSTAIFSFAKGANVASATTTTLGTDGNFFVSTGTTTITSITVKSAGTVVILDFAGVLTLTDGSNLKLGGNFVTTADDTITLISDGTNWIEMGRSVN